MHHELRKWRMRIRKALLLGVLDIAGAQELRRAINAIYADREVSSKDPRSNLFDIKFFIAPNATDSVPWSEQEFIETFRFHKSDMKTLSQRLCLGETIKTRDGYVMSSIEALCVTLRRLSQPDSWQTVKDTFPHRRKTHLKSVFYHVIDHIATQFGHLLDLERSLDPVDLHYWARKMTEKGSSYERCCLLVDGKDITVQRTQLPQGMQSSPYFSGHHHKEEMHFLAFTTPAGIIRMITPLVPGRYSDASQMIKWDVANRVGKNLQPSYPGERHFLIYGDSGFGLSEYIAVPVPRPRSTGYLEGEKAWLNKTMSSIREEVEHTIGKPTLLFKRVVNLRLKDQTPVLLVQAAIILTNCYHCLHRSQTSIFFDCLQPSLEDYLAGRPMPLSNVVIRDKRVDGNGDGTYWVSVDQL